VYCELYVSYGDCFRKDLNEIVVLHVTTHLAQRQPSLVMSLNLLTPAGRAGRVCGMAGGISGRPDRTS
jgi:hypothetical protein